MGSVQNKSLSLCIQVKKNKTKKTRKVHLELIYENKIDMSKKKSLTSYRIITKKNKQSPLSNYNLPSILIIIKKIKLNLISIHHY